MSYEFKVGDTVTIREWDDMEREFGLKDQSVNVPFLFTREMGKFCGKDKKIGAISYSTQYECFNYHLFGSHCSFSEKMFLLSLKEQEKQELSIKLKEEGEFNEALI